MQSVGNRTKELDGNVQVNDEFQTMCLPRCCMDVSTFSFDLKQHASELVPTILFTFAIPLLPSAASKQNWVPFLLDRFFLLLRSLQPHAPL